MTSKSPSNAEPSVSPALPAKRNVPSWLYTRKEGAVQYTPAAPSNSISKLRDRLNALRHESGSFSSTSSAVASEPSPRDTPSVARNNSFNATVATTRTRHSSSGQGPRSTSKSSPSPGWKISTKTVVSGGTNSSSASQTRISSTVSTPYTSPRRRPGAIANGRSPPHASPQPRRAVQQTPLPVKKPTAAWDDQLGALEALKRQLTITAADATELSNAEQLSPSRLRENDQGSRSSAAQWKKFQELALQLEEAKAAVKRLELDDDDEDYF